MPQIPYTYASISQRVADRVFDGTVLCQIATWISLNVQIEHGELFLKLDFIVDYHSLLDNNAGDVIPTGKGLQSWSQSLYANNACAVYLNPSWIPTAEHVQDPRNGEILYYRGVGATWNSIDINGTATELVGGLEAAPEPVIKQGDAFALQMEYPMGLAQLIRYHLAASNLPPFSKFS